MNWGYKIMIVYGLFVIGIVFLVIKSSNQNQDLVTENYYEQELKYQEKIDETVRANELSTQLKYNIEGNSMKIIFPAEMINKKLDAEILIYCTADKNRDLKKKLSTETGQLIFALPEQNKGLHEIKVSWKSNGLTYYNEHKMLIQ